MALERTVSHQYLVLPLTASSLKVQLMNKCFPLNCGLTDLPVYLILFFLRCYPVLQNQCSREKPVGNKIQIEDMLLVCVVLSADMLWVLFTLVETGHAQVNGVFLWRGRQRSLEAAIVSPQVLTQSVVDSLFQWKRGSLKLLERNDVYLKEGITFTFTYDCWAVQRCVNPWIM